MFIFSCIYLLYIYIYVCVCYVHIYIYIHIKMCYVHIYIYHTDNYVDIFHDVIYLNFIPWKKNWCLSVGRSAFGDGPRGIDVRGPWATEAVPVLLRSQGRQVLGEPMGWGDETKHVRRMFDGHVLEHTPQHNVAGFVLNVEIVVWLVVSTPLKNISQLGGFFPILGKITNVPNHQPVINSCPRIDRTYIAFVFYIYHEMLGHSISKWKG